MVRRVVSGLRSGILGAISDGLFGCAGQWCGAVPRWRVCGRFVLGESSLSGDCSSRTDGDDEPHTVKVWVLESSHGQYEPFYVSNVYSSLEKAQASATGAVWGEHDRAFGGWVAWVDADDDEWGETVLYRITEKELL